MAEEATGGWRPIETAPNTGEQVWVFGGHYSKPTLVAADGDWWRYNAGHLLTIPTHWRPLALPEPPQ